ncbi:MAG: biotin--[acetyl-CoA-carboxylase] ligase [Pseudomonadales bacterium]|nr:biotin--[acetyl-CoA-carboxylase] ligase [Pseudomonadales bacterium]
MPPTLPDPDTILAVLASLADGEPRPADDVAAAAGLSAGTLAAARDPLADHGVRWRADGTLRVPGGVDLLAADAIEVALAERGRDALAVHVLGVTGSTNDDVRARLASERPPFAVLAEAQRAGRGRRGRSWASPVACNLYLSLALPLPGGVRAATGLSLVVGVAVAEALDEALSVPIRLKWPNDLLVDDRKLGGILVELAAGPGGDAAVVGIGVNVRQPGHAGRTVDQAWIDLAALVPALPSRNLLAAAVAARVLALHEQFLARGFDAALRARWSARDPWRNRTVVARGPDRALTGISRGVDESGALLLDTGDGIERIGSGEVSLRLGDGAAP